MSPPPHTMKCPCCNNPWAAATGDMFAQLCQECNEEDQVTKGGLSRSNMDFDVHPKDNFYYYANGNWLKNNPIPSGYPNWNSFLTLHVQSQENLKCLLEELAASTDGKTTTAKLSEEEQKVSLYYSKGMDEEMIETNGIQSLQKVLDLCDKIASYLDETDADSAAKAKNVADGLGTLALKYGISAFMSVSVSPDKMDSNHSIGQLSQGGLGLPDRDYYFDDDKSTIRDEYKKCIETMITMLENNNNNIELAQKIYNLEEKLAKSHMTRTENRDPHATYNKMSIEELQTKCSSSDGFDFVQYMKSVTGGKTPTELGDINIRNVKAIECIATTISSLTDSTTLKGYLHWCTIKSCAPYLSKVFVNQHFEFYEKTLSGTKEIKPRWKRVMAFTESALGEALGKLYCAKYFDESSKTRAVQIVEQVRQALEDRLKEVDWIKADSTREQASKKMERFRVKIGYPDKWIDYTPMKFEDSDSFLDMTFKSREFDNYLDIKEMNAPTDRTKWFLTPQTVNAYYHPNLNEIVFPAAILQHPFFDKDADDAVNFGAMGAVVGHEMTHGFDDQGRKYDFSGVLNDWWTEEDGAEYEKRVEVMVDQANKYEVHGQTVQGKLTSGENISDLGGLRLALRALKAMDGYDPEAKIDGFTPVQRFFLSWAQCWRQNITKERSLQLLTIDPHGPNEMRCNGPLSNMAEFHDAFDVETGTPMFKPEGTRVDIW